MAVGDLSSRSFRSGCALGANLLRARLQNVRLSV